MILMLRLAITQRNADNFVTSKHGLSPGESEPPCASASGYQNMRRKTTVPPNKAGRSEVIEALYSRAISSVPSPCRSQRNDEPNNSSDWRATMQKYSSMHRICPRYAKHREGRQTRSNEFEFRQGSKMANEQALPAGAALTTSRPQARIEFTISPFNLSFFLWPPSWSSARSSCPS